MILMLLLMAGIIPDRSPYAQVYVLPQCERIASWEPGDKAVQFYDLQGQKVGALAIPGELQVICEALGTIFITVAKENHQYNLMLTDKNLRAPKIMRNTTFYYANVVDGKIYGLDRVKMGRQRVNFPRLATLFEPAKLRYGSDSFFKLPSELAYQGKYPMKYWIFEFGDKKLALMQGSFNVFQLDDEYLGRESIDSEKWATPFRTTYPTDIPGDSALRGKFYLSQLASCEEAQKRYQEWLLEREVLFEVWLANRKIFIAYGSLAKGSKIGFLDDFLQFQPLVAKPGIAIAGSQSTVWLLERGNKTRLTSQRLD